MRRPAGSRMRGFEALGERGTQKIRTPDRWIGCKNGAWIVPSGHALRSPRKNIRRCSGKSPYNGGKTAFLFLQDLQDLKPELAESLYTAPVFRNFHFIIKAYPHTRPIDIRHTARLCAGTVRARERFLSV